MKKLSIALAVAGAFAASSANAAMTLGDYDVGCLVPFAIHDATINTVVGITARNVDATPGIIVYWTFFDVNSNHVTDGQFAMTDYDQHGFSWAASAGTGLAGRIGYLTFFTGTAGGALTTDEIACNAFHITANDAAFIPAPAFTAGNLTAAGAADLTTLVNNDVIGLAGGTPVTATNTHMRYWIDGATGGRDTSVAVWTSNRSDDTYTVNIYNDAQGRKSVNFVLPNQELNVINPEAIVGRPADYLDGFIDWRHGTAAAPIAGTAGRSAWVAADNGFLTYSIVTDGATATQTLTAPTF